MIPKIIHWCWVGPDSPPPFIKKCVASWKKYMPDYEIRLWDRNSFDMKSVPYVKEAFEAKKWAFVADYIRLYALYHYGGIYLDSDVMVYKSFDPFLNLDFFSGQDVYKTMNVWGVEAAILGAIPKHSIIGELIEYYNNYQVTFNNNGVPNLFSIPPIISKVLEPLGYQYKDEDFELTKGIKIFSTKTFCNCNSIKYRKINYAFHINTNYYMYDGRGVFFKLCWKFGLLKLYRNIETITGKLKMLANLKFI